MITQVDNPVVKSHRQLTMIRRIAGSNDSSLPYC